MTLIAYTFPKIWTPQDMAKCLKSPVSVDHLTGNVVNVPKHYFNLNDSTFTKFIDHVEGNWVGKSLC